MKTALATICCILAIITVGTICVASNLKSECVSLRKNLKLQADASKSQMEESASSLQSKSDSITQLESQIASMKDNLAALENKFDAASQKVSEYEKADQKRQDFEAQSKIAPPPTINSDGKYFFSKVVSRTGATLLENATFISLAGGSYMAFRTSDGEARSFNAGDVHPLTFQYLHIDLAKVRSYYASMNADGRMASQNAGVATVIATQQAEDKRRYDAAIAVQRQQAQAQQAAADAAQAQADADKQQAAAAMLNAQRPATQVNIIQQQGQSQGRAVNPNTGMYWSN